MVKSLHVIEQLLDKKYNFFLSGAYFHIKHFFF